MATRVEQGGGRDQDVTRSARFQGESVPRIKAQARLHRLAGNQRRRVAELTKCQGIECVSRLERDGWLALY